MCCRTYSLDWREFAETGVINVPMVKASEILERWQGIKEEELALIYIVVCIH